HSEYLLLVSVARAVATIVPRRTRFAHECRLLKDGVNPIYGILNLHSGGAPVPANRWDQGTGKSSSLIGTSARRIGTSRGTLPGGAVGGQGVAAKSDWCTAICGVIGAAHRIPIGH